MKNVRINVNMDPPVRCYQMYAYPLSIIFTNQANAIPWFISNFINIKLCIHKTDDLEFMDVRYIHPRYELCEMFDSHTINQSVYKKGYLSDINQLLKNALYDGYAVSLVVDEYYVTNRIRYQNEHKRHQIMVYGYNATEELYDVLGYDTNYAYSHTTITPKQLEEAFYKYEIIDTNQDSIILMGMKSFEKPMSANMDLLCKELNEYITNTNTYCPEVALYSYTKKFYFGFNVYDIIREFVQKPDYKLENYPLFYMIYEHKRNFVFRMQYIMEEYGIDLTKQINAYNNIEKKSKYLLNLFLKYMVSNTPKKKNEEAAKIVKIIDEIIADEKSCLPELLEILSKMQYT